MVAILVSASLSFLSILGLSRVHISVRDTSAKRQGVDCKSRNTLLLDMEHTRGGLLPQTCGGDDRPFWVGSSDAVNPSRWVNPMYKILRAGFAGSDLEKYFIVKYI